MITSNSLGQFVRDSLVNQGIKVVYYHGENALYEEQNLTQQELKDEHFVDVNKFWTNY